MLYYYDYAGLPGLQTVSSNVDTFLMILPGIKDHLLNYLELKMIEMKSF